MVRAGSISLTAKVIRYGEGGVNVTGKTSAKEHATFVCAEFWSSGMARAGSMLLTAEVVWYGEGGVNVADRQGCQVWQGQGQHH